MTKQTLSFSRTDSAKFFRTLNKRVNTYFKENNIKRTGNWKIWLKTIVMFTLFLAPLILILTLNLPSWLQIIFVVIIISQWCFSAKYHPPMAFFWKDIYHWVAPMILSLQIICATLFWKVSSKVHLSSTTTDEWQFA